jgi:hypothetical protein
MDVERIIDEIEQLQEMFEAPDIRPLSPSDLSAANRRHGDMLAHSPWSRLWQLMASAAARSLPNFGWAKLRARSVRTSSRRRIMGLNWSKDIDQTLIAAKEQSRPMEGSLAARRSKEFLTEFYGRCDGL